jgi:hypothetical protein
MGDKDPARLKKETLQKQTKTRGVLVQSDSHVPSSFIS